MRALVLHGPGRLALEDRPPLRPQPGWVRLAVEAVGLCSSDVERTHGGARHSPLVIGHEFCGRLLDPAGSLPVGVRVTAFPLIGCGRCFACAAEEHARCAQYDYVGSRRDGAMADEVLVPAAQILEVPGGVDVEDAALTEPLAVVVHALDRLVLEGPGDLAVVGGGFLGLLAVLVQRARGDTRRIVVVGREPARAKEIEGFGASFLTIADSTPRRGTFPFVLEAAGTASAACLSLELAAPGGQVVWMGNPSGDIGLPRDLAWDLLRRELTLRGTWNSRWPTDWTRAMALLQAGLRPSVLVDRRVDFPGVIGVLDEIGRRRATADGPSIRKAIVRP